MASKNYRYDEIRRKLKNVTGPINRQTDQPTDQGVESRARD